MSQEPKVQPHFGSGVIQTVCLTCCVISSSAAALGGLPLLRPSPRITSVVRWFSAGRYSFLNCSAALPKSLLTSASRTRPEYLIHRPVHAALLEELRYFGHIGHEYERTHLGEQALHLVDHVQPEPAHVPRAHANVAQHYDAWAFLVVATQDGVEGDALVAYVATQGVGDAYVTGAVLFEATGLCAVDLACYAADGGLGLLCSAGE